MLDWLKFWKKDRPAAVPAVDSRPTGPATPPEKATMPPPEATPRSASGPGVAGFLVRLEDNEAAVRRSAAAALARIGPAAGDAIPALLRAAVDVDAEVRKEAAEALSRIDPAWPGDPRAVTAAPVLVRELGSKFSEVWRAASSLLVRIGAPAVPELLRALLLEEKDTCQVVIIQTLGAVGGAAAPAVPALAAALKSPFVHVRLAAAAALGQIGPAAAPALPELILALADWLPAVRLAATQCLARVGPAAEGAVPTLTQLLSDREEEVRLAAAEALAQAGPAAVPALIEVLESRDLRRMSEAMKVRMEVSDWWKHHVDLEALRREPLKALRNVTWYFQYAHDDGVEMAHTSAAAALGKIGPLARDAVPVLIQTLFDKEGKVRLAAARALGGIGQRARGALPALVNALIDPKEAVRKAAAEGLAAIDAAWSSRPEAAALVPDFVKRLRQGPEVRSLAAEALAALGAAAVTAVAAALASEDRVVRETAANILGRIGPAARNAASVLRQALQDGHNWVREAAAKALEKVDPPVRPV